MSIKSDYRYLIEKNFSSVFRTYKLSYIPPMVQIMAWRAIISPSDG